MFWTALLFGLASSGHCLVMCGPLVLAMQGGRKWWHFLLYHAGRILSYLSLGLLFGLLGKIISLAMLQQGISIVSGVLLLLFAALFYLPGIKYAIFPKYGIFPKLFQKLKLFPVIISVPLRGALNGLLPCGMVYLASAAALSAGSISFSILYMLLFGIGTLPALVALSFGKFVIKLPKLKWQKAMPYLAIFIACLFILRGLSMDIPYLSPKITVMVHNHVKSCCEKR